MNFVITRTPFRISFLGGGTDYPPWYLKEGGQVLSTTIDKYCYISARILPPFFDSRHRVVWSHIENVQSIADILHPAVREGLRMLGFDDSRGLEIHHQGDLPARTGMGSSSSFAVGLIRALLALRGETPTRQELALRAIELEQNWLKDTVGSQDQTAAAFGGFNHIRFGTDGSIRVEPVAAAPERLRELSQRLMLFYTGTNRFASRVAADVVGAIPDKTRELRLLSEFVDRGREIVEGSGDLDDFGRLLHETWSLKRSFARSVSSPTIDSLYEMGRLAGALGGKLLGAGGAGFMLFYARPEDQSVMLRALGRYLHVPFRFESSGCTILLDR